jgi:hypothetical protein
MVSPPHYYNHNHNYKDGGPRHASPLGLYFSRVIGSLFFQTNEFFPLDNDDGDMYHII